MILDNLIEYPSDHEDIYDIRVIYLMEITLPSLHCLNFLYNSIRCVPNGYSSRDSSCRAGLMCNFITTDLVLRDSIMPNHSLNYGWAVVLFVLQFNQLSTHKSMIKFNECGCLDIIGLFTQKSFESDGKAHDVLTGDSGIDLKFFS